MIPLTEASRILTGIPVHPGTETVPLGRALKRVLARDVNASVNMPPFDKSAMDGYAVLSSDEGKRFEILEIIPAGGVPEKEIRPGTCAKIMTGAMIPRGADRVIKVEVTRSDGRFMTVIGEDPLNNICYRGEDVRVGDSLLKAGILLKPADIGILASQGIARVKVFRRPRVGLLVTGEEIIEPGGILQPGQIFNSNAHSISAQLKAIGLKVDYEGMVGDDPRSIRDKIETLRQSNDIILVSGGVSMGDFDHVPGILEEAGFRLMFQKVAIKPGKPTVFGLSGDRFVFGLPGNPVSTFMVFEVLVKPFLYRMMGHDFCAPVLKGALGETFSRKKAERTGFVPVRLYDGMVDILEYHGSAHIHALSRANGILEIPAGVKIINKGEVVDVRSV